MNRKVFAGLVILMGFSIVGIIVVQLVWMNNAIKVKDELFSRSINEALNNTVGKLEEIQNMKVLKRMVFTDTMHVNGANNQFFDFRMPPPPIRSKLRNDSIYKNSSRIHIVRGLRPKGQNASVEIKVENRNNSKSSSYSYQDNSDTVIKRSSGFRLHSDENMRVIVFEDDSTVVKVDSLISVSGFRIDSVMSHLDTLKIHPDVTKRMRIKAGNLKNLANRVVTEIVSWDSKEPDIQIINKVLTSELQNRDIPISFVHAMIKDNKVVKVFPENADSTKLLLSEYKVNLYPNDIFQKNMQLAVYFPGRDGFVYRSLSWLLLSSLLFSIFILLTFSLSIYYLLRQKKISEMKSDFINNMTHEFKTPIATISVAADSIVNDRIVSDPEKVKYFAGMIKKENSRMNRQVEDILTIARLDRKEFEFVWEKTDIHELINDTIQGISLQIEKKGGKIETLLLAKTPVITTDKIHCTNLFFNLLDNALKYSPNSPEIKIITSDRQNGILVTVEDKGIGMSKNVQGKIFERFYRQTTGNIHNVKGFGLGLNYVKAVVEANKGTITVQSEPGKGSRFEVFLPYVRE